MMTLILRIISIVFLTVNAVGALAGGFGFMIAPDGSKVGMNVNLLHNTPFDNFLIPGIILFVFNGLLSVATLFAIIMKSSWAERGIILQGIILYGWILCQVVLLGFTNWLHVLFGFIAIVLIICGYLLKRKKRLLEEDMQ